MLALYIVLNSTSYLLPFSIPEQVLHVRVKLPFSPCPRPPLPTTLVPTTLASSIPSRACAALSLIISRNTDSRQKAPAPPSNLESGCTAVMARSETRRPDRRAATR